MEGELITGFMNIARETKGLKLVIIKGGVLPVHPTGLT